MGYKAWWKAGEVELSVDLSESRARGRGRAISLVKTQQILSSVTVVLGSGCRELIARVWLASAHA